MGLIVSTSENYSSAQFNHIKHSYLIYNGLIRQQISSDHLYAALIAIHKSLHNLISSSNFFFFFCSLRFVVHSVFFIATNVVLLVDRHFFCCLFHLIVVCVWFVPNFILPSDSNIYVIHHEDLCLCHFWHHILTSDAHWFITFQKHLLKFPLKQ